MPGRAEAAGARDLFVGVNALDYSGYPDCRPEFIAAFEALANKATKAGVEGDSFTIHAPLLHMTKADIAREAARLGLDAGMSWSCYDPTSDLEHCGLCDACRLRAKGFEEAGIADPDAVRPVMTYAVKEAFLTLQGEGVQSGSRAVFLRFAGCNLWSGREQDRAAAQCNFCDTDFVGTDGEGGGKFADADSLAGHVEALWGGATDNRLVVVTGGEPMLQLDEALVGVLHDRGFRVAAKATAPWPRRRNRLAVRQPEGGHRGRPAGRRRAGSWSGRRRASTRPSWSSGISTISWSSRWTAPTAGRRCGRRSTRPWQGRDGA